MLLGANLECDLRQAWLFVSVSFGKLQVVEQWWWQLKFPFKPQRWLCVYRDQSGPGWGWIGASCGPCLCFEKLALPCTPLFHLFSHERVEVEPGQRYIRQKEALANRCCYSSRAVLHVSNEKLKCCCFLFFFLQDQYICSEVAVWSMCWFSFSKFLVW